MNDMTIDELWTYACSGNITRLKTYYNNSGKLNRRYDKFSTEHSLIMGAFRNNQYDTVEYLMSVGETLTEKEKEEMLVEHRRINVMCKLLSNNNLN